MSTTDSITVTSSLDAYGNTYTTSVSGNDELENDDFITLMLTELSMQDPTSPVDSSSMLDDQMTLSTLEANVETVEAMQSLQATFEQTALSTSASLIGNIIENGETNDSGDTKQYKISSVESIDGEIYLTAYEISGFYDTYTFSEVSSQTDTVNDSDEDATITFTDSDGASYSFFTYNKTYAELAEEISAMSGITASMNENSAGNYQMLVSLSNGNSSFSQTDELSYYEDSLTAFSSEADTILYTSITKIY